jgi:translation elongation factor EF-4
MYCVCILSHGDHILYTEKEQEARVGDTFHREGEPVEALPGFKPAKPMVFAGLYPGEGQDFETMRDAIEKLTLNDASVVPQREVSKRIELESPE